MSSRRVLIAGGSIAGLVLANALEQIGIDYVVLEKWHEIAPDAGASIGIFPNGARILDQLGCYDAINAVNKAGNAFEVMMIRDSNGKVVFKMDDAPQRFAERLVL